MQKINDFILNKFLDTLVEELKRENDDRIVYCKDKQKIDIPFIISSLYQNFKNHVDNNFRGFDNFRSFISDLYMYPNYNICILDSQNDYGGIIDIEISLSRKINKQSKYGVSYIDDDSPNYKYKFCFTYDERNYKYCDCTPDMTDYREDKHCCGHGCDASFCEFSLYKILHIASGSWEGDEHDYWNFEDDFYMKEKELDEKKKNENKEREIKELKNRIEADQKRLAELEGIL